MDWTHKYAQKVKIDILVEHHVEFFYGGYWRDYYDKQDFTLQEALELAKRKSYDALTPLIRVTANYVPIALFHNGVEIKKEDVE